MFCGNLPGMYDPLPSDLPAPVLLDDILSPSRRANVKIVPTLTTTPHSQLTGGDLLYYGLQLFGTEFYS